MRVAGFRAQVIPGIAAAAPGNICELHGLANEAVRRQHLDQRARWPVLAAARRRARDNFNLACQTHVMSGQFLPVFRPPSTFAHSETSSL